MSILSSVRAHRLGGRNVTARWLRHPLLTDMAAAFFHCYRSHRAAAPQAQSQLQNSQVLPSLLGSGWGQRPGHCVPSRPRASLGPRFSRVASSQFTPYSHKWSAFPIKGFHLQGIHGKDSDKYRFLVTDSTAELNE